MTHVPIDGEGAQTPKREFFPSNPLERIDWLRKCYLRVMSVALLGIGIYQWGQLLGAFRPGNPELLSQNLQTQAATLFFAVADLVAAIGLWLTATWGMVIWLAAAGTRIYRHTVFASALGWDLPGNITEFLAIVFYGGLLILRLRESRREVVRQTESRRKHAND